MSQNLFPEIRAVAEETEKVVDKDSGNGAFEAAATDDDRPVQEIESLCMRCGEQVRMLPRYVCERGAEHADRA